MEFRDPAAGQQGSRAVEPSFSFVQHSALFGIALLFAIGTSVLSWSNARAVDLAPRFHWPDETTNHFFAMRVARGEPLEVPEPRNVGAGNIIHPRTANVRADGAIVPGAYLGLPLWYGLVGRVLGEHAMLFVTPILAALGLLAFASIIRRFWNPSVAIVATMLLTLHPSGWIFTATAMLPNVPFIALLLLGFMVLIRADSCKPQAASAHPTSPPLPEGRGETKKDFSPSRREREREGVGLSIVHRFLGGLLIGLALTIRTHELVWVGAMLAVLAWRSYKLPAASYKQSFRSASGLRLAACALGIILPFVPILLLNAQLYGSPFTTGYALLQEGGAAPTEFAPSLFPGWITALIAPFGWHPIAAFDRFWNYLIVPYPWFTALAVAGFARGVLSHFRTKMRKNIGGRPWAVMGAVALTVWLVLYYGSWELADPLVRETNVLTISYVRYWLPIVVFLTPWAAIGLLAVIGRMPARWRAHTIALVSLGIVLTSFSQAVTDPTEGLIRQRQAIVEHRVRARAVIAATEPNAVIVSHRMDRVFFPERAVVHAPDQLSPPPRIGGREGEGGRGGGDPFLRNLRSLVDRAPVYWYAPSEFAVSGFTLVPVDGMPFGERFYRVE